MGGWSGVLRQHVRGWLGRGAVQRVTGNRALAGKRRGGGVMWWYGAGRRDAMAVGELGHERARCPEVEQAKQVTGSLQSCTTWRRERHLKHRRCLLEVGNEKEQETPLMRGGAKTMGGCKTERVDPTDPLTMSAQLRCVRF
jgi:hypothetical protein